MLLDAGLALWRASVVLPSGEVHKLTLDAATQKEFGVGLSYGSGLSLNRPWGNYRLDYSVPQTSGGVVETGVEPGGRSPM